MATRLDDLFKQYNDAVSAAGQQYNDAMAAANQSYDTLMQSIDADEKAAWDTARSQYQDNRNRAQMAHNAQLLGDLAHLGVQTWATAPGAMGSAGSNAVIPAIKPTDKYLERGEAWRQKMNQSYLDEVAARTKRKREDALRGLERGRQAAADQRAMAYKAADAMQAQALQNYNLERQAGLDKQAQERWEAQQAFQQRQADRSYGLQVAAQAENRRYHDALMAEKEAARLAKERGSSYKTGGKYDTWIDGNGNIYEVNYNRLDFGGLYQLYKELGGNKIYSNPSNTDRLEMIKHITETISQFPQYGEYLKKYERTGAVVNRGKNPTPADVTPPNNQQTGLGWGSNNGSSNEKTDW